MMFTDLFFWIGDFDPYPFTDPDPPFVTRFFANPDHLFLTPFRSRSERRSMIAILPITVYV